MKINHNYQSYVRQKCCNPDFCASSTRLHNTSTTSTTTQHRQLFHFLERHVTVCFHRVSILDLDSKKVTSRVFKHRSFRSVTLQDGVLALRSVPHAHRPSLKLKTVSFWTVAFRESSMFYLSGCRESTVDNLVMVDLEEFLENSRGVGQLFTREVQEAAIGGLLLVPHRFCLMDLGDNI